MPDGEITPRFARCWQAALKALPNLMPRFALTADGFRIPLPHGCYRLYRSVLLDANLDEGNDMTVEVDPTLLHKGGLYRMSKGADGIRLESLQTAIPRWKVALRMLRKHRITMRAELLRRMRDGVAFEFSRQKGAIKVTLKAGKMPSEVRIQYRMRATLVRDRLNRVRDALAELEAEGERAAEIFAAESNYHRSATRSGTREHHRGVSGRARPLMAGRPAMLPPGFAAAVAVSDSCRDPRLRQAGNLQPPADEDRKCHPRVHPRLRGGDRLRMEPARR